MGRAEDRRARQRGGGARRAQTSPSAGGRADRRRAASRGSERSLLRRIFTWKKVVGTLFGLILLCMGAAVGLYMYVDIPNPNDAAELQSNVYKDINGKTIANVGDTKREIVDLSKIPKDVQHVVVAAENKTFYKDPGVDIKGTTRGVLNTLMGKGKQGGSTITQQYVKNYYLTQEQTVSRKVQELVIALKIDRQISKDEILAGYLNTSYFGRGVNGIQAAAQAYYGVDAQDLTLSQGAYLAALLQAPNQYDWAIASETGKKLAKDRWAYALDNMVEMGWLSKSERAEQKFQEPQKPKQAPGHEGQNGYHIRAAKDELARHLMKKYDLDVNEAYNKIDQGGWTIQLAIDPKKQKALEKAVKKKLTSQLDPKKRKVDAAVQAGAVSVDPKTGKVVALYGGEDFLKHERSNATRRDYQPGSTFKPVILASALENASLDKDGEPITPNTVYDGDSEVEVEFPGGAIYDPPNEGGTNYGPITVQTAMNHSTNSVFAAMGADVGMDKVVETATNLGMREFKPYAAMTLGSMEASPYDLAGVYSTFAAHGKKVTPSIIKSVEHAEEGEWIPDYDNGPAISRQTADTVTAVLQGVTNDGGTGATVLRGQYAGKYEAAGKTGTTDENVSALFAGYTPELVTVVGLYGEAPEGGGGLKTSEDKPAKAGNHVPLYGAGGRPATHGAGFPAEIWAEYTLGALNGGSDAKFDLEAEMGPTSEPTTQEPTTEAPTTEAPDPSEEPSDPPTETQAPPTETIEPTDPETGKPTGGPSTIEPPIDPDPSSTGDTEGDGNGNGGWKPRTG